MTPTQTVHQRTTRCVQDGASRVVRWPSRPVRDRPLWHDSPAPGCQRLAPATMEAVEGLAAPVAAHGRAGTGFLHVPEGHAGVDSSGHEGVAEAAMGGELLVEAGGSGDPPDDPAGGVAVHPTPRHDRNAGPPGRSPIARSTARAVSRKPARWRTLSSYFSSLDRSPRPFRCTGRSGPPALALVLGRRACWQR